MVVMEKDDKVIFVIENAQSLFKSSFHLSHISLVSFTLHLSAA